MRWRMDWWHRLWNWVPERPRWWFAWYPVKLDDTREWAWLERVDRQVRLYEGTGLFGGTCYYTTTWHYRWQK